MLLDIEAYARRVQPVRAAAGGGYSSAASSAFRERSPELLERFPFPAVAVALQNTWRPSAVVIYRNWLSFIATARAPAHAVETVSLARL
jgi:hypothetical protein